MNAVTIPLGEVLNIGRSIQPSPSFAEIGIQVINLFRQTPLFIC